MATIFGKMKELEKRGTLTTERSYHQGWGEGESYRFENKPVKLIANFVGNVPLIDGGSQYFREPTDVLVTEEEGFLLIHAEGTPVYRKWK